MYLSSVFLNKENFAKELIKLLTKSIEIIMSAEKKSQKIMYCTSIRFYF